MSQKPTPQEKSRWKRALQDIIDGVDPDQRDGIASPDDLCSRAWFGRNDVSTVGRELAKLGNSEATGPKARQLTIDIIRWLAEEPRNWITTTAQADALLAAALCDKSGKGYGNSAGPLGKPTLGWPLYEQSGYLDIEQTLARRLRGPGLIARPSRAPAAMSGTLLRLESCLKQAANGPESVSLVVIPDVAGAGKSELVRQLRTAWESSNSRLIPFYIPLGSSSAAHVVRLDFGNARIGPSDLATALNEQTEELLPGFPGASTPRSAARQLLEALRVVQTEGVPNENNRKPDLIILDNLVSVEPIDALVEAALAPDRVRCLVVLITCPSAFAQKLTGRSFRSFRVSPIHTSDANAILARGLGSMDGDAKRMVETIAERLWRWPSLLDAAHGKLTSADGSVHHRLAEFVNYLDSQSSALVDAKGDPNRFQVVINAFGLLPAAGPYINDARRRKAVLEREANRDGLPLGFDLNKQFVSLSITVPDQGYRPSAESLREAIEIVNRTRPEASLFVLTAPPGAGKSTLLRRAEWEQVTATLSTGLGTLDMNVPLLLYVALNAAPPDKTPRRWLHEDWWPEQHPEMPPLSRVLEERTVWLLLDAANELPGASDVADRIRVWVTALDDLIPSINPRHRVIFSCRQRDKGDVFDNNGVVEIGINAIDPDRLPKFLDHYLAPAISREKALASLRQAWVSEDPTGQIYGLPIWLKLLCNHINESGLENLPRGRAALVAGLVRRKLLAEGRKDAGLLRNGKQHLVTMNQWPVIAETAHFLDNKGGSLLTGLEKLAYGMLRDGDVSSLVKRAHDWVGKTGPEVLDCAHRALDLIKVRPKPPLKDTDVRLGAPVSEWRDDDSTRIEFIHQQFLEYFAGRHIARSGRIDNTMIAPVWGTTGAMGEAILFAAAIFEDDHALVAFLRDVMRTNLPLAARCVGRGNIRNRLQKAAPDLLTTMRTALQQRLTKTSDASRAERIDCAEALFWVGHPDFEEHTVDFEGRAVRIVIPKDSARILIRGGVKYWFGSNDNHEDDEKPRHQHQIDTDFRIAKYPLTNYEFACFVDANGYGDPRWWVDNPESQDRRSHGANERIVKARVSWAAEVAAWSLEHYEEMIQRYPDYKATYDYYRSADPAMFKREQEEIWPLGKNDVWPRLWYDAAFNALGQPVVGVDFYEARAYTRWLNALCRAANLSVCVDLPTEDQWEASCGGEMGRKWAADSDVFDPSHYNTTDSTPDEEPVWCPTPVGAFPRGATPEGIHDLSGNVWEWCLTEYVEGPAEGRPRNARPSDANDPGIDRPMRVVRGGSWDDNQFDARTAYRFGYEPFVRDPALGIRLVFYPC